MADKKIITVFGATGSQGGSVAHTFLSDPKLSAHWDVRAVTRDINKDSSKALAAQGAEVVAANLDNKSTVVKAVEGSAAVFAVTNYWEHLDAKKEIQQGKNIVDAAKEAGAQHLIWSSLLDINKLSGGKLPNIYHFDSKAAVEEYARSEGVPSTFFMPGFYLSNLPGGMFRQLPPDNAWTLTFPIPPSAPMPVFDTEDTGKYVKAIVLNRDRLLGKRFYGATEYLTAGALVDGFKEVFPEAGKTAKYNQVTPEIYKGILLGQGMPDFAAEELLENFLLFDQFGYYGGASLDETHELVEDKLTTWVEYAKKSNKWGAELK